MVLLLAAFDAAAAQRPEARPKNAFSFEYEYEAFGGSFAPWVLATAELSHRFDFGPIIARVNHARRFGQGGTQLEADAYPRLGHGMYLYANAGTSQSAIFPRQRFGAEIYKNLPNAFETSLGFRQLNFTSTSVTLYTGTIAKYSGNNYYVVRPYFSHHANGDALTGQFMMRTYFATADDYASLTATYGKSPTEDITPDAVDRLSSWNIRATAQRVLIPNVVFSLRVGYSNEQFRLTAHRRGWIVGAGIQRRF